MKAKITIELWNDDGTQVGISSWELDEDIAFIGALPFAKNPMAVQFSQSAFDDGRYAMMADQIKTAYEASGGGVAYATLP
jgi:hypothetical protein